MGEKLVFELGIENLGSEPIDGARIHTRGKWNDDTVRNVMAGTFKEDFYFEGSNFHTSLEFLPGEPLYVNLVTYPKKEKKKKTGRTRSPLHPIGADGTRVVDTNGQNMPVQVNVTLQ